MILIICEILKYCYKVDSIDIDSRDWEGWKVGKLREGG